MMRRLARAENRTFGSAYTVSPRLHRGILHRHSQTSGSLTICAVRLASPILKAIQTSGHDCASRNSGTPKAVPTAGSRRRHRESRGAGQAAEMHQRAESLPGRWL
jgi:hypothetical protein